jgi:tetratricopeptide (TPR) repeat protein
MGLRQSGWWNGIAAGCLLAAGTLLAAGPENPVPDSRTVIGETNPDLADGARKLLAGDTKEGIRLTRLGLDAAHSSREREAGLSNLCAGYLRLDRPETALAYCDKALDLNPRHWRALCNRAVVFIQLGDPAAADVDLTLAESIAPNSRSVQAARGLWRDTTDPVEPSIVIDDSREEDPGTNEKD